MYFGKKIVEQNFPLLGIIILKNKGKLPVFAFVHVLTPQICEYGERKVKMNDVAYTYII